MTKITITIRYIYIFFFFCSKSVTCGFGCNETVQISPLCKGTWWHLLKFRLPYWRNCVMKNDAWKQFEWHWNFFKVNMRETRRKQLSTVLVITLSRVATQLCSQDHHRHSNVLCSTVRSGRPTDVLSLTNPKFRQDTCGTQCKHYWYLFQSKTVYKTS